MNAYNTSSADQLFYCSSPELLKCFGITKQQCTVATDKAIELCSDKHIPNSKEATEKQVDNVANCASKQFLLISSISEKELNKCKPLFLEALQKEIARLKSS